MPRWLGVIILLATGVGALCDAASNKTVYFMGGRRVTTWVGKTHAALLGVFCIAGAIAIALGGHK